MEKIMKSIKIIFFNFYISVEDIKQVERSSETVAQLTNEIKELKASIENVVLEQKLVEKKTLNTMKEIDKTKEEIERIKESKEKLMLEIVDLQDGNYPCFLFISQFKNSI